jgi:hypothetical protein
MATPQLATATFLTLLTLSGCIIQPNGPGQNSPGAWGGVSNEVPLIATGEAGESNATFKSNYCVVHYNTQGVRTEQTPVCTNSQLQKADTGMAATRREQGL